jgi:Predicted RNA-binding protein (contains KH domain)
LAEFLLEIVRRFVEDPGAVSVEELERDGDAVLRLTVAEDDRGKVIGRQGRIIRSLRTLVRAGGAREGKRYLLEIAE